MVDARSGVHRYPCDMVIRMKYSDVVAAQWAMVSAMGHAHL